MYFFKYREKRYGKFTFRLFSIALVLLAIGAVVGGIIAFNNMQHWSRFVILVVCCVVGLSLGGFGLTLFGISFSLISKAQSVRDGNAAKGISGTRLCDKCGRVISKEAEFCEHCGQKQLTGVGMKKCPNCKALNSGAAAFCEKCGTSFDI